MAKNKKNKLKAKAKQVVQPAKSETAPKEDIAAKEDVAPKEDVAAVDENVAVANNTVKTKETKNKVVEIKAKDVNKKDKKKEKKPNKLVKSLKDTGNELKKVSWPKFKEVVKQTGVVLAFTIVLAIILFGIDRLCMLLTGLLY